MNTNNRRFFFIDYDTLRKIKFKKLEKVATKIFVFVGEEVEYIPAFMVYQIQKMGKALKWIQVEKNVDGHANHHISFLMGKLHQKLSSDVQFAILSDEKDFDALIRYINDDGRSCIRVQRKKSKLFNNPIETPTEEEEVIIEEEEASTEEAIDDIEMIVEEQETDTVLVSSFSNPTPSANGVKEVTDTKPPTGVIEEEYNQMIANRTADETMYRLRKSGNRPAEIDMLKNYILLNNQEMTVHGNIDMVIQRLQATRDIEIEEDGKVKYHF